MPFGMFCRCRITSAVAEGYGVTQQGTKRREVKMMGDYIWWMDFWRNATKERRQEMWRNLSMCMHAREERLGNAREEKMDLCEWLKESAGFRLEACRVPNEFGEFIEEMEF